MRPHRFRAIPACVFCAGAFFFFFQGESTQPDQDLAEAAFMRPTVASQAAGAASPKFKTARELEKEALRNERAEREELNSEARLQWEKRRVKMAAQN